MNEMPIYVGLTTLPSRIGRIRDTLESLVAQSVVPDKIFLSIPERSVREQRGYDIPEWLMDEFSPRVDIVRCAEDFGPGTKLLGCLPRITREACLILVDDDLKYSPFVIERLSREQLNSPESSFSFFVYKQGPFPIGQGADGFSFYTPNLAGIESFAEVALRNRALFVADDLWISMFLANKRIRVRSLLSTIVPGEVVYEQAGDRPNQLRHLQGDLERQSVMSAGTRYLVKSGLLGNRLRLAFWFWQIPGLTWFENWLRRTVGPYIRRARGQAGR
mgnify:CR=1 FL=1